MIGQALRFPEVSNVNSAARDLIKGLLVKEPRKRSRISEARQRSSSIRFSKVWIGRWYEVQRLRTCRSPWISRVSRVRIRRQWLVVVTRGRRVITTLVVTMILITLTWWSLYFFQTLPAFYLYIIVFYSTFF